MKAGILIKQHGVHSLNEVEQAGGGFAEGLPLTLVSCDLGTLCQRLQQPRSAAAANVVQWRSVNDNFIDLKRSHNKVEGKARDVISW